MRFLSLIAALLAGLVAGLGLTALVARDERLAAWRVAVVDPSAPRAPQDGVVDLRVSLRLPLHLKKAEETTIEVEIDGVRHTLFG
jgi:hypothetical protein